MLVAQHDFAGAAPRFEQALEIGERNLDLTAAVQAERQQLAMAADLRPDLDAYLTIGPLAKVPAGHAYRHVLTSKGAVLERQRHLGLLRRLGRANPDSENARLFVRLEQTTTRLATLALGTPDPKQADAWRAQVAELTREKEELESKLAGKDATFRAAQAEARRRPEDVQASLPRDAALIDFLEYTHFRPPAGGKGEMTAETHLLAFVVRRDRPIVRIDLGPRAPIAKAVEGWRALLRQPVAALDGPARDLRKLVWEPLEPHLEGTATVLVSPDGVLGSVPLAALPGKKAGSYLIEDYTFAVVPVPRMLDTTAQTKPGGTPAQPAPTLLLVGDVEYGGAAGKADPQVVSRTAAVTDRAGLFADFTPLPSTGDEIAAIGRYYRRRFPDGKAVELDGPDATEDAFRRQAPKHRYLHLATHGYFAPETLRSALGPGPSSRSRPGIDPLGGTTIAGFHPGLLSGIALAGANRRPAPIGADDGILTALEVASLDLSGCELAVLSACETGLGMTAGGEGLLGLQRAFQVAGAQAVVASLWSVGDKPTQALMARFYENLWRKNLPPPAALREAQLYMLREGLDRGGLSRTGACPGGRAGRAPRRFSGRRSCSAPTGCEGLVNLDLRSWSPGFSRSFPPKGGTPTHQSTVDSPLRRPAGIIVPARGSGHTSPTRQRGSP